MGIDKPIQKDKTYNILTLLYSDGGGTRTDIMRVISHLLIGLSGPLLLLLFNYWLII